MRVQIDVGEFVKRLIAADVSAHDPRMSGPSMSVDVSVGEKSVGARLKWEKVEQRMADGRWDVFWRVKPADPVSRDALEELDAQLRKWAA